MEWFEDIAKDVEICDICGQICKGACYCKCGLPKHECVCEWSEDDFENFQKGVS